jgi:D-threo-aldose 1-dehydrogenase
MMTQPLGRTGLRVPPILFGTSCLGNLYQAVPYADKLASVREMVRCVPPPLVLDSAGKYGAGLALETIGRCLRELAVPPAAVLISNKLGWQRVPLTTPEPTFEPGAWVGLEHDARQTLDEAGVRACFAQGNALLGAPYRAQLVSLHDPDEYLAAAPDAAARRRRWQDLLAAYRVLFELKAAGQVQAVGVGAKDWRVIRDLAEEVPLDWVMLACSLTVYTHPPELVELVARLHARGVGLVNSAVFNAGFLIGGQYFDYRVPDPASAADQPLFAWRERFLARCREWQVAPATACVQFGRLLPGVVAVALNTSKPARIADNVASVTTPVPAAFWRALQAEGLIAESFPLPT